MTKDIVKEPLLVVGGEYLKMEMKRCECTSCVRMGEPVYKVKIIAQKYRGWKEFGLEGKFISSNGIVLKSAAVPSASSFGTERELFVRGSNRNADLQEMTIQNSLVRDLSMAIVEYNIAKKREENGV